MRAFLKISLLLVCSRCWAQLPMLPSMLQSSGALPIPQQIPGLVEWWQYSDTATNNTLTNSWVGKVQGTMATNGTGTSAFYPSTTVLGVIFGTNGGRSWLTNMPITLGTNWTVVVRQQMRFEGYSASSIYDLWGQNGGNFVGGFGDGTSPKATIAYINNGGGSASTAQIDGIINNYRDVAYVMSNSIASPGNGNMLIYTNGVGIAAIAVDNVPTKFSTMGWNSSSPTTAYYLGFVKDYWLYTNILTTANLLTLFGYSD